MSNNQIQIDLTQLNVLSQRLSRFQNEIPGAMASALNRTVDFIYTRIGKIVTEEYVIKTSDVKSTITKKKASKARLTANLKSKGSTLSFSHFRFTPRSSRIKRKVKIKIKRNDGFKTLTINPNAFVQNIGGTVNVFVRDGADRYPIRSLRTLSVPQMIQNTDVENKIHQDANRKLGERIEHEVWYRLQRQRRP